MRWLNPVKPIQAETGWPHDLCKSFVQGQGPSIDRILLIFSIFPGAAFVAMTIFWLSLKAGWVGDTPEVRAAWTALVLGLSALSVLWLLAMSVTRIVWGLRARRALPRFLEAPWFLKCRYAIGAIADECVRCPECGYGIRWQIAELAEGRAKG